MLSSLRSRGVQAALLSAALFGVGTPAAKYLLDSVSAWLLAGLLYLGSGLGLGLIRLIRRSPRVHLARGEYLPLGGAITFGGILGPVLLMVGLVNMPASGASLLLNAEGVFTALLACLTARCTQQTRHGEMQCSSPTHNHHCISAKVLTSFHQWRCAAST